MLERLIRENVTRDDIKCCYTRKSGPEDPYKGQLNEACIDGDAVPIILDAPSMEKGNGEIVSIMLSAVS